MSPVSPLLVLLYCLNNIQVNFSECVKEVAREFALNGADFKSKKETIWN